MNHLTRNYVPTVKASELRQQSKPVKLTQPTHDIHARLTPKPKQARTQQIERGSSFANGAK
jgi:hypothetical protein